MLGEAGRTLAGEATDGVRAQELTVVLFGRTFIQILIKKNKKEQSDLVSAEEICSDSSRQFLNLREANACPAVCAGTGIPALLQSLTHM